MTDRARALPAAVLFAATATLLYAPALRAPFVYDAENLEQASLLHVTSLGELWRILAAPGVSRKIGLASFALNFYFGGLDPLGYHLVNLVLHLLTACALFFLSLRLLTLPRCAAAITPRLARLSSLGGALFWLIHPVQTQAVSYVYQRFTVLCAFFFILSLLAYVEGRLARGRKGGAWFLLSGVFALLALGSKENAGALPLLALLVEMVFFMERPFAFDRRRFTVIVLFLAAFFLVAAFYLGPHSWEMIANESRRRGFTPGQRLLTEGRVVLLYVSLLAYPHPSRLRVDYDFPLSTSLLSPPSTLVSALAIGGLLALAVWRLSRNRFLSFAILWFFGNLAIESTIIPLDLVYEHRLYLPSMALLVVLAGALGRIGERFPRGVPIASLALVLVPWGYWTRERNWLWRDPVALWEDNARKAPGKARVRANLGKAYQAQEQYAAAKSAFEQAIALDPSMVGARVSLANIYVDHLNDFARAREILEAVIEDQPGYVPAHLSLGVIHMRDRQLPEAIAEFERALDLDPTNEAGLYNLAAAHLNEGRPERASRVLERAVRLWPLSSRLHGLLGAAYLEAGEPVKSLASVRRALSLDSANALAAELLSKLSSKNEGARARE